MRETVLLLAAFLLGSFPFALWVARARGVDLRGVGSGNLGATNAYRALGPAWGLGVLALDMGKGALAVGLSLWLGRPGPAWLGCAALIGAVLGHMFTPFSGFKGGKGVAAGMGGFLVLAPLPGLVAAAVWSALFAFTRTVSIASLAAFVALPVATWFLARARADYAVLLILTVVVAALVWLRHRDNIRRLLRGEENALKVTR